MTRATVRIDPAFVVGPVRPRTFGSFVEHMGRCVYTGIYEPGHPQADELGFRRDVADLVRELGVTTVRYPGGNFVSNYRWEDGVGPKADRPTQLDLAWRSVETNQVGTDDFVDWARSVGVEPMMAVNLGTRGMPEAVELLLYCNGEKGTSLPDRRVENGHPEPHDIRVWCLGNEMDGPWQIGHKTAEEYARVAEETARAMLRIDGDLELVACGSSNRGMPTFGTWERTVLERCFDFVDHISAHAYYEPVDGDVDSFLASSEDMHRFIESVVATADHVAAVKGSDKRITVSFDEWNVWFQGRFDGESSLEIREAPELIEDVYDVTDAVVVGSLLITLLQHTDRVSMACQAQLVNVIAPIVTRAGGPAWRQSIFHPFALTAKHARGTVLRPAVRCDTVDTRAFGPVDQLVVTATHDAESGDLTVFVVNRSRTEPVELELDVAATVGAGPAAYRLVEHLSIHDDDTTATNTEREPDRVTPRSGDASIAGTTLSASLPPTSWHCIRLTEGTVQ
ncbi:MAG: Alpha-N-arabinofuranosidase [Humibacillus sp.]|nr:Alpha-N-arabinofuranosidase [Humibacillus sp.]